MEKEQEVERERDRARSTRFFDSKLAFNDPPPKVRRRDNCDFAGAFSFSFAKLLSLDHSPQE